ncbi:tRNA1(Val) (adenine(37)-N6)-methyltransferase [Histidinibacterium lentulum]|uniref:Methyltransferase domain-containing protein n=1 Tax=Histidinibacterium lentulum TaxID=2480588 RepID=A0A3N2QVU1_9RHOB|nr:methyltransferase domain-containing protein [Histidinibacterium lentulum]ROT99358.1 methyltransferase domain-containing protein [Histidinibacterium lentulum]
MTSTSDAELTRDAFLGGRLHLWQPRRGFRAGVDAILLAAAVPARAGECVLELGCGAGAAVLALLARVPGAVATGVEVQPDYAALARRNALEARLPLDVVEADLARLPPAVRGRSFDHVMMNPPYFAAETGTGSADPGRDTALRGDTPLPVWIDAGLRRLRPGGRLTAIQRIERLPEMLSALDARIGSVAVAPLQPRAGRPPQLFLLSGKKGGRAPFRMTPPTVLHEGARHETDAEDYAPAVAAALRDGAALALWD